MSLPQHFMISDGPRPVAPFSHAVEANGFVSSSPARCRPIRRPPTPRCPKALTAQTRRVMENLRIVLAGLGLAFENIVMARIYLTEFDRDYAELNALWPSFFETGKLPARTTVGVTGLAVGALVEIDLVAVRP